MLRSLSGSRVYVSGHMGMVGSALSRALRERGDVELVGWTSSDLDLRDSEQTRAALAEARPDVVIMAAARVGGILANSTYPVEFLNDNLLIQTNVFKASHEVGVQRLLFLGSSCIYPKFAQQPIREDSLLTGPLEPTNYAYALAKISGVMAVKAYRAEYGHPWISAMPTNLYGPNDNFDPETSHVLPGMIRKFHDAKEGDVSTVALWGTGTPRREFLHVDDLAQACLWLLEHYDSEVHVNVGVGTDISISELAAMIAETVGYRGSVIWDDSKPDGTPRKLLDSSLMSSIGWKPSVTLRDGLRSTYEWFLSRGDW